ncbi:MAG: hypothetical protein HYU99_11080 [Deltaproteobacteria bacterium]|nr:hypothetical protein [Deltaproteobacteria bacterium]
MMAIIRSMMLSNPKPVYHLCGTSLGIDEFFEMVAKVSGVPKPNLHLPIGVIRVLAKTTQKIDAILRRKDHPILPDPVVFEMASKYWGLKSLYARDDLGFVSRNPYETLLDTVRWLCENHPGLKTSTVPVKEISPASSS